VELALNLLQQVVVEQEFSPFYARQLTIKMGLQGNLIAAVSDIVEKMYQMFIQKDLDMVEINPLGVSSTGALMALDGKVTVNERAIARHPDIVLLAEKTAARDQSSKTSQKLGSWDEVEPSGNTGILSNGAGLVMATLDLVSEAGGKPATCLNVGHGHNLDLASYTFGERLEQGLEFLSKDKSIRVVLINILASVPTAVEVAEVIASFLERHSQNSTPSLVVRLAGSQLSTARERLAAVKVPLVENLDEAVAQTVRLSKAATNKRRH